MGLKSLTSSNDPVVEIKVLQKDGLFLVEKSDSSYDCIYAFDIKGDESYFTTIKNCKKIKFIGSKEILSKVLENNSFLSDKLERSIDTSEDVIVWYYPETGKVRIPKNNDKPEEFSTQKSVLVIDDSNTIRMSPLVLVKLEKLLKKKNQILLL